MVFLYMHVAFRFTNKVTAALLSFLKTFLKVLDCVSRVSDQSLDESNSQTLAGVNEGVWSGLSLNKVGSRLHTSELNAYLCYLRSQNHLKAMSAFIKLQTKVSGFGSLAGTAGG